MENFRVGDIAILKSGGPDMIVLAVDGLEKTKCQWEDIDGNENTYTFPSVMLRKGEKK